MKRVCVCAHFGEGKELLNGQSIKAHIVANELEHRLGGDQIIKIDTHGGYLSTIKLIVLLLRALVICENIIVMPGKNGLRIIIPLLRIYSMIIKRKIHYIVIGGWLDNYLKERVFLKKLLYKCDCIYVETQQMKTDLEMSGFRNIVVLPNCKALQILSEAELVYNSAAPYKLCTFSRVTSYKGIEDAIFAVESINAREARTVYLLDIYGPVDDNYKTRFEEIKGNFPGYIRYCGTVPYSMTTEIIKDYYLMLFPTRYETEGLPGTIIDAYASGVPVVASDWRYSREFVNDRTGFVYEFNNAQALTDLLYVLKEDPAIVNAKKTECIKHANRYTSEAILSILTNRLD